MKLRPLLSSGVALNIDHRSTKQGEPVFVLGVVSAGAEGLDSDVGAARATWAC